MIICKNCGVELEPYMKICPLCEEPVNDGPVIKKVHHRESAKERTISQPQRRATWELVSLILIFITIMTSILNYILNKEISWAEYPVAVCLILFSYISSFAFLNQGMFIQFLAVSISSSLLIYTLDVITGGPYWALKLGIPILVSLNLILLCLLQVIRASKKRGINIIAYSFVAAAVFCLCIETAIDFYANGVTHLVWSLIICACLLPVAAVLLFMHFRLKKGTDLNKTFHI